MAIMAVGFACKCLVAGVWAECSSDLDSQAATVMWMSSGSTKSVIHQDGQDPVTSASQIAPSSYKSTLRPCAPLQVRQNCLSQKDMSLEEADCCKVDFCPNDSNDCTKSSIGPVRTTSTASLLGRRTESANPVGGCSGTAR